MLEILKDNDHYNKIQHLASILLLSLNAIFDEVYKRNLVFSSQRKKDRYLDEEMKKEETANYHLENKFLPLKVVLQLIVDKKELSSPPKEYYPYNKRITEINKLTPVLLEELIGLRADFNKVILEQSKNENADLPPIYELEERIVLCLAVLEKVLKTKRY